LASGDTLFKFTPSDNTPPTSAAATPDLVGATVGWRRVLDFAGSVENEIAIFDDAWGSQYAGNGADFQIHYGTDGTSTGAVQFFVSFEILVDTTSMATGGATFGAVVTATDTPSGTANQFAVTATVAVPHTTLGSPVAGQSMRCRLERNFNHATNTDDAQFLRIVITET
jgi:hypothetical protein